MVWSIPQKVLAGLVLVMGTNETEPVNLPLSVAPKSSSPFWSFAEVVGTYDTPTRLAPMRLCEAMLSVTVGMVPPVLNVSCVLSVGPMPRMPSNPCWMQALVACVSEKGENAYR
jgi:hypothetical protein